MSALVGFGKVYCDRSDRAESNTGGGHKGGRQLYEDTTAPHGSRLYKEGKRESPFEKEKYKINPSSYRALVSEQWSSPWCSGRVPHRALLTPVLFNTQYSKHFTPSLLQTFLPLLLLQPAILPIDERYSPFIISRGSRVSLAQFGK